jgi:hypothetical protein
VNGIGKGHVNGQHKETCERQDKLAFLERPDIKKWLGKPLADIKKWLGKPLADVCSHN